MSLLRRFVLCACLCALTAACSNTPTAPSSIDSPGTSNPSGPTLTAMLTGIVDLTNRERASHGLGTLAVNGSLTQAAQLQSDQMVRLGRMAHELPEGQYPRPEDRLAAANYRWQAYGENLAFGYSTAAAVVQGWMDSPGHRANILGASYTEIGVGLTIDTNGRPYYTQVFGRPR